MDDAPLARTAPLPAPDAATPALATAHATLFVLPSAGPLPPHTEVAFQLVAAVPLNGLSSAATLPANAGAARIAYVPRAPGVGAAAELRLDGAPLAGNAFRELFESGRALAALVSVAAGRRMESGPQSERIFVFLRGHGLVFLENGETQTFAAGDASVLPAGEAVRVWAQGPEDVLAVVLQPRMAPRPQRTLAGEIAKRRQPNPGGSGSA